MSALAVLADVIVPVALIAGVGAVAGRVFDVNSGMISRLSLHVLTPALAIDTLLGTEVSGELGMRLAAAFTVGTLAGAGLGWLVALRSVPTTRRTVMVSVALGNNGNMGLPIALFALGSAGLDQTIIVFLCSLVLTFILGPLLYGAHGGIGPALRDLARMPVLWSIVAALTIRALDLSLPTGLLRGVELLGQASIPMVLLALGMQLAKTTKLRVSPAVAAAVVARIVVLPVIALGLGLAFGLPELSLQALVLAMAMPTAVNAFLLAGEYHADVETVTDVVTLSTLASLVSLTVVISLLPAIGGLAA